jgi:hypothetical protein
VTSVPNLSESVESGDEGAIMVDMTTNNTASNTITVAGRTYEQRKMSELVAGDIVLVGYDMGVNLYSGKPVNFLPFKSQMNNSATRADHSVRRHTVNVERINERIISVTPVNSKNICAKQYKFSSIDRIWVEVK